MNKEGLNLEIELLERKIEDKRSTNHSYEQPLDIFLAIHSKEIKERILLFIKSSYPQWTTRAADDLIEAYSKLENSPADLVVCEYSMPYMSGCDFMIKLHTNTELKRIPVILISSLPLEGIIDSGIPLLPSHFDKLKLDKILQKLLG